MVININWTKVEEDFINLFNSDLDKAFRPDCIPDNIREWVRFIEQYEHIIALPDDFDPSFEGMTEENVDDLMNKHLYLGYGYKKSPIECWRDTDTNKRITDLFKRHGINLIICIEKANFFERMKGYTHWDGYKLEKLPKHIAGNLRADDCNLRSLEGFPETIGGDFNCSGNKLESLKGGPRKVGGYFNCSNNFLKNFIGGPIETGGAFYCDDGNDKLESLEGSPKKCNNFLLHSESLTSLENGPETVTYDYNIGGCFALKSLEGITHNIGRNINIRGVQFESTKGIQPIIAGAFNFSNSSIKYLHDIVSVGELNGIRSNLQPCTLPKVTGGHIHLDATPYIKQENGMHIKQNESIILTYKQFKNDC